LRRKVATSRQQAVTSTRALRPTTAVARRRRRSTAIERVKMRGTSSKIQHCWMFEHRQRRRPTHVVDRVCTPSTVHAADLGSEFPDNDNDNEKHSQITNMQSLRTKPAHSRSCHRNLLVPPLRRSVCVASNAFQRELRNNDTSLHSRVDHYVTTEVDKRPDRSKNARSNIICAAQSQTETIEEYWPNQIRINRLTGLV